MDRAPRGTQLRVLGQVTCSVLPHHMCAVPKPAARGRLRVSCCSAGEEVCPLPEPVMASANWGPTLPRPPQVCWVITGSHLQGVRELACHVASREPRVPNWERETTRAALRWDRAGGH